jgi:antitoxin component of RelBE/YafQ-DinJ toxin-antitoxin module
LDGVILAKERVNITVDPEVLDEFYRYAAKKGIKFSTWVQVKMEEFIEEEKQIEEWRMQKKR